MTQTTNYDLQELNFEKTLGGQGREAVHTTIPRIDLRDFAARRQEITDQLWQAATDIGFFQLVNHGIDIATIEQAFACSEQFFTLPEAIKERVHLKEGTNAGWEYMAQVRPSTGTADRKESYQITLPRMTDLWPTHIELPDFQRIMLDFEYRSWQLGMEILSCFADKLGFPSNFFATKHDRASQHFQSTLRLLHYLPLQGTPPSTDVWRAGAHTDFDCLTMVFQKTGQGGLQVCAGKDAAQELVWTGVEAQTGIVTCNIGDMLTRWSDDRLKSTLHRVRMPRADEYQGSRYSLAYFCQADRDAIIQGPEKKYEPISASDFLRKRIAANFAHYRQG